ncbi:MAG TPA: hydrogenase maturation protease [Bacillota bacterium]|nr:hydrogenase maturation protease [Bacillota bacterium]
MQTVVIGLGNPLLSDEGVGIHLLRQLECKAVEHGLAQVRFYDLGTSGTRVLHAIAGQAKAVFLDCALMGEPPGTIRRFSPEEVESGKEMGRFSLHEGDLLSILELSRRLGECPPEVVIFGIQPEQVESGFSLSETLGRKLPEYVTQVWNDLI